MNTKVKYEKHNVVQFRSGVGKLTFNDGVALFKDHLQNDGVESDHTFMAYVQDLKRFSLFLVKDVFLSEITPTDIKAYNKHLEDESLSPKTINRHLATMKKFFGFFHQQGTLPYDITAKIKRKVIQEQSTVKWLTVREVGRIFHAIKVEKGASDETKLKQFTIVSVLVNTGLRVAELCNLNIGDVDFKQQLMFIRNGKGKKFRFLPLNKNVTDDLKAYLHNQNEPEQSPLFLNERGSRLRPASVQHLFRRLSTLTGLEVTPHALRHTMAMQVLAASGGQLNVVKTLLGHQSIKTTAIYTQPSMNQMKQYVNGIMK